MYLSKAIEPTVTYPPYRAPLSPAISKLEGTDIYVPVFGLDGGVASTITVTPEGVCPNVHVNVGDSLLVLLPYMGEDAPETPRSLYGGKFTAEPNAPTRTMVLHNDMLVSCGGGGGLEHITPPTLAFPNTAVVELDIGGAEKLAQWARDNRVALSHFTGTPLEDVGVRLLPFALLLITEHVELGEVLTSVWRAVGRKQLMELAGPYVAVRHSRGGVLHPSTTAGEWDGHGGFTLAYEAILHHWFEESDGTTPVSSFMADSLLSIDIAILKSPFPRKIARMLISAQKKIVLSSGEGDSEM